MKSLCGKRVVRASIGMGGGGGNTSWVRSTEDIVVRKKCPYNDVMQVSTVTLSHQLF